MYYKDLLIEEPGTLNLLNLKASIEKLIQEGTFIWLLILCKVRA